MVQQIARRHKIWSNCTSHRQHVQTRESTKPEDPMMHMQDLLIQGTVCVCNSANATLWQLERTQLDNSLEIPESCLYI